MAATVLFLVVQLGGDRYAIATSQVVEVMPLVRLKALPGAPAGTAGLMSYRGVALPVVDLPLLFTGTPAPATTGTRIVVVRFALAALPVGHVEGAPDSLGLVVSAARDTVRLDPDSFVDGGIAVDAAPWLGRVLATPEGVLQRVDVAALLTAELRGALHRHGAAA